MPVVQWALWRTGGHEGEGGGADRGEQEYGLVRSGRSYSGGPLDPCALKDGLERPGRSACGSVVRT